MCACWMQDLLSLLAIEDSVLMEISLFCRHDNLDGDLLGNFISSKRPPHKSKPMQAIPGESPAVAPAWEKMDKLHSSEPSLDTKRMGEKIRPKSGLIVRGMMAGPIASSPQVGHLASGHLLWWEWKVKTRQGLRGLFEGTPQDSPRRGDLCVGMGGTPPLFSLVVLSAPCGNLISFLPSVYPAGQWGGCCGFIFLCWVRTHPFFPLPFRSWGKPYTCREYLFYFFSSFLFLVFLKKSSLFFRT